MDTHKQEGENGGKPGASAVPGGAQAATDRTVQQRIIDLQQETRTRKLAALAKARQVKKDREEEKKQDKLRLEQKQAQADLELELLQEDLEARQERERKRRNKKRKHAHLDATSLDSDAANTSSSDSDDDTPVRRPSKRAKREPRILPPADPPDPPDLLHQAGGGVLRIAGDTLRILVGTGLVSFAYAAAYTLKPLIQTLTLRRGLPTPPINTDTDISPSMVPTDNSAWFRD
jgi:hypothetical protein